MMFVQKHHVIWKRDVDQKSSYKRMHEKKASIEFLFSFPDSKTMHGRVILSGNDLIMMMDDLWIKVVVFSAAFCRHDEASQQNIQIAQRGSIM